MLVITDEIKARMRAALGHDKFVRNILGVALGEIQTAEARANRALTDDETLAVLRNLVKSNEETLGHSKDDADRTAELEREIEVLSSFLPTALSSDEVAAALEPVASDIRAAKTEGQAMGVAMKHLKASGAAVDAKIVNEAVKTVRGAS